MASRTSIKDYFGQFSVAMLASAVGGVLATAFLTWWNWAAVKTFLAGVGAWCAGLGAWLIGTTTVYRVVLLTDFLVLAAVLAWAAPWWHRSRAAGTPLVAPEVDRVVAPVISPPRIATDFNPTRLQVTIILILMQRWQQQTTLQNVSDMVEEAEPEQLPEWMAKAHIARELEILEAANCVSIDRLGEHHAYYHLTALGRDWIIQRTEAAKVKRDAEGK